MKFRSSVAVVAAVASALSFTSASSSPLSTSKAANMSTPSDVQLVHRRGRDVAIGIGALIGTAIILSEAARADGHRRYRRDSMCGRLLYDCEDGSRRACHKYEDRCM